MPVDPEQAAQEQTESRFTPTPRLGPAADESHFKDSIAAFSRQVGERAKQQASVDPKVAAANRKAALQASIQARRKQLLRLAGIGGAGVAIVAAAILVITIVPFGRSKPPVEATAAGDRPAALATAAPTTVAPTTVATAPPPPPSAAVPPNNVPNDPPANPAPVVAAAPPVSPPSTPSAPPAPSANANPPSNPNAAGAAVPSPAATPVSLNPSAPPATQPPPVQTVPAQPAPEPPLTRQEITEVQTRLDRFGFNPGPADGNAGPMTRGAVMRYQQERGIRQTGEIDQAFLDQLRGDPAPPVGGSAPAASPAPPSPSQSYYRNDVAQASPSYPPPRQYRQYPSQQRGGSDSLTDGIRAAGDSLSRFLYSIAP